MQKLGTLINKEENKSNKPVSINTSFHNETFSTKGSVSSPLNLEEEDSGRLSKIGKISFMETHKGSPRRKSSIKDFEVVQVLGKGSYAKVVLAKNLATNKFYALKVIDKLFLTKEMKKYEVYVEKFMLSHLDHPNVVKLYSTFQDEKKLYFMLEYCPNKDLSDLVKSEGKLNIEAAQFYLAEVISALEYMHSKGIYHRDLKPENILLDENLHLKICDFGTANMQGKFFDLNLMQFVEGGVESEKGKILIEDDDTSEGSDYSAETDVLNMSLDLVGTPEYVAPEVLLGNESAIGPTVDLWALGCILYYLLIGKTPFKDKTNLMIFDKILKNEYSLKEGSINEDAADLVKKLLVLDPNKRLGANQSQRNYENTSSNTINPTNSTDFSQIKSHPFFKNVNWETLNKSNPPLYLTKNSLSYLKLHFKTKENLTDLNNSCIDIHCLSPILTPKPYANSLPTSTKSNNSHNSNNSTVTYTNKNSISYNYDGFTTPFSMESYESHKEAEIPHVVYETVVKKKSPWLHYNTRILKLLSNATLEYYDPRQNVLKGTIHLSAECKAELVDEYHFDLVTKNRKFVFNLSCKFAGKWVDKINLAISNIKAN